jgi:hypothetical protein
MLLQSNPQFCNVQNRDLQGFLPSLIYWSSDLSLTALAECFAASSHRLALITRSFDASFYFLPAATASQVCAHDDQGIIKDKPRCNLPLNCRHFVYFEQ